MCRAISKLRSILEVNCRRVTYDNAHSVVSSIYFDDVKLRGYTESVDGTPRRAKLRLRWYDGGDSEGRFFFEIKRRIEQVVDKERVAVESETPLSSLSYFDIHRELGRVLPPVHQAILMSRPEPVLIIEYKREYFRALDSPVRITLDYGLVYYDQSGLLRPKKRFGTRRPEMVIVEGKAPVGCELSLPRLLYPLRPQVTRCSKYVTGCQVVGVREAYPS